MNIGLDHTGVLGSTVEQIAMEKAGIIKPGCACVLYEQQESVEAVVKKRCAECGVPLRVADFNEIRREFDSLEGQVFSYKGESYAIPLMGEHQLRNAAVVLEVVEALRGRGWKLPHEAVEHGALRGQLARPLRAYHSEPLFVVDGGHNPQCAKPCGIIL